MIRTIVVSIASIGLVAVTASPAAAVPMHNGVKTSNPPMTGDWSPTAQDRQHWKACSGPSATVVIRRDGDLVYVQDNCKDGASAIAHWRILEGPDKGRVVMCRNSHGVGTWARCNEDWAEGNYLMTLAGGEYDGDTGALHVDHGTAVMFAD